MLSSKSDVVITVTGRILKNVVTSINQTKRGIDLLMERVATGAFHNSDELYDAPKCHPHTRVAVLDEIMKWVDESEAQDDFVMWLFGPAGAGKSAIAKKIAELAAERALLIGTFFFSRISATRNTKDRLIPTLAYQMAVSIPGTRAYIEEAIEADPAIFSKNLQTQIDALLIKPFQFVSTQTSPFPKLIIIDGLDECTNSQAQVAILDAISHSFPKHNLPIIFLLVSRPEVDLVTSFNGSEALKSIHRRLSLDDNYYLDEDIRLFFSDKFEQICCSHRLRSTIPKPWPTEEILETLVRKSSGQFIFAATVVRFIESNRHRPTARLDAILGTSPLGTNMNPFTELDALYEQIFSSVDDIELTLRVLSLYAAAPDLGTHLHETSSMSAEFFLSLEEGDISLALINLSSIVSYNESSGMVKILHASLIDFLSDKRRSKEFYIDMASTRTDFFCRTLQYVKGPDGIRAGDYYLFESGMGVRGGWLVHSQLTSDILNFDLDAFIMAMIKISYKESGSYGRRSDVIWAFFTWMRSLTLTSSQAEGDRQLKEAVSRCNRSFESRVQKYESDWRLQLLLTLAVVAYQQSHEIPECRCLDILLEMDDHQLHLVDKNALDLRHTQGYFNWFIRNSKMIDIIPRYVDGDRYASTALHCMSFLSKPPKYSEGNDSLEMDLTYLEWKATCDTVFDMLCGLLPQANTSPELVKFMSNHDINSEVRKNFPAIPVWQVDTYILAFLSRACVCVNWRIVSAIQPAPITIDKSLSESKQIDVRPDQQEGREMMARRLLRGSVDQCCNHLHYWIL